MKTKRNWLPLVLTLTVIPGMGHLYLKKKWRGYLFVLLSLGIVVGGFARYMYVLFAVANIRRTPRPPDFQPWEIMAEAWRLDYPILLSFLVAFFLVWALAALDIVSLEKRLSNEQPI